MGQSDENTRAVAIVMNYSKQSFWERRPWQEKVMCLKPMFTIMQRILLWPGLVTLDVRMRTVLILVLGLCMIERKLVHMDVYTFLTLIKAMSLVQLYEQKLSSHSLHSWYNRPSNSEWVGVTQVLWTERLIAPVMNNCRWKEANLQVHDVHHSYCLRPMWHHHYMCVLIDNVCCKKGLWLTVIDYNSETVKCSILYS